MQIKTKVTSQPFYAVLGEKLPLTILFGIGHTDLG